MGIHPKVAWPAVINAILTAIATISAAATNGGKAAIIAAAVGSGVTVLGALTGYAVPSPASASSPTAGGGGSITEEPST